MSFGLQAAQAVLLPRLQGRIDGSVRLFVYIGCILCNLMFILANGFRLYHSAMVAVTLGDVCHRNVENN